MSCTTVGRGSWWRVRCSLVRTRKIKSKLGVTEVHGFDDRFAVDLIHWDLLPEGRGERRRRGPSSSPHACTCHRHPWHCSSVSRLSEVYVRHRQNLLWMLTNKCGHKWKRLTCLLFGVFLHQRTSGEQSAALKWPLSSCSSSDTSSFYQQVALKP